MGGSVSKRNSDEMITGRDEKRPHIMPRDSPSFPLSPSTATARAGDAAGDDASSGKLVQTVFRWEHGGSRVRVATCVGAGPAAPTLLFELRCEVAWVVVRRHWCWALLLWW